MSSSETQTNGHLPVLASEARPIDKLADAPLPAPAIAATGGFLAGVATLVLVRVLRRTAAKPRRGIGIRRKKRDARALEIAGSRSFLVDVHILKR